MRSMARSLLCSLLVFTTVCTTYCHAYRLEEDGPVVQTQYGPVKGMYVEEGVIFFGLPFAAPPTGNLRWKPPQPFSTPWAPTTYDATGDDPKPGCIQSGCKPDGSDPHHKCPRGRKLSEDCLYLNVFAPRTALNATAPLPVMFWLYGGNFLSGSGSAELYDGRFLANKTDTIVVTTNYRLGALGFLVAGEGEDAAKGNYGILFMVQRSSFTISLIGILDQLAALKWVRENIGNFGGDKNRVTTFGQSAGSGSIGVHLTYNKSAELFQRAIMMSVPFGIPFRSRWEALSLGNHFAGLLNCSNGDMSCLRSASEKDIRKAQRLCKKFTVNPFQPLEMFIPWGPTIDGDIIQEQLVDSFAKGHLQRKPFIIGTVMEESRLFIYANWETPMSTNLYNAVIFGIFREKALSVLGEYKPGSAADQRDHLAVAATDFLLTCPTRTAIRGASAGGNRDVWLYVFDHIWSFKGIWEGKEYCVGHCCHGEDLPFTFQTITFTGQNMTAEEQVMADSIAHHYGNFAHTGDPNKPGRRADASGTAGVDAGVTWPRYDEDGGFTNLKISTPKNKLVQEYKKDRCDFWHKLNDYP
ncbi:cAMP-regulated D2 protein-like [Branchiostoma lanceolatum]|uniref:cAMP-regulated D2 protein-like n=1 Tax=Branchiostoma lanceolatum TaxID=7740 RepID=UPI0034545CAE